MKCTVKVKVQDKLVYIIGIIKQIINVYIMG